MLRQEIKKFLKDILFHTRFRKNFFPLFQYNFTASQLCFLCQCLEKTKNIQGEIVEVGCAGGSSTVFLNKYMDSENIDKKYYAIDTFSGFVTKDIDYEVTERNKKPEYFNSFKINSKEWFDGTMSQNGISRVKSIKADVNVFDLKTLGAVSFAILDVDLYRPMNKCLHELYEMLSPGGILVVDDCNTGDIRWDGSDQAYKEFIKEKNHKSEIVHGKLGVIRKQS